MCQGIKVTIESWKGGVNRSATTAVDEVSARAMGQAIGTCLAAYENPILDLAHAACAVSRRVLGDQIDRTSDAKQVSALVQAAGALTNY